MTERDASQFGALAPHYDELMQVVPYEQWVEYVMLLWRMHDHRPRQVLDCACGTGNVSFELARQGLDVVGVDLSEPMIVEAQRKATQSTLNVEFVRADLTDFDLGRQFDSATCLYDSLNYILDPAALQRAFDCIGQHIQSGGVWIFDMNSEFALQADLFTQSNRDPRKKLHYGWQANYDIHSKICSVQMEFQKTQPDGSVQTFYEVHRERAYALDEIEAMLNQTGWQLLRSYDAYTLNRPHARSERWYFAARKI
jgi:SAM-dependent methyltransferase